MKNISLAAWTAIAIITMGTPAIANPEPVCCAQVTFPMQSDDGTCTGNGGPAKDGYDFVYDAPCYNEIETCRPGTVISESTTGNCTRRTIISASTSFFICHNYTKFVYVGNETISSCSAGYYGPDCSNCESCPANATCPGGTSFSCNQGYYRTDNTCTRCPQYPENTGVYGTTNGSGATSISECYIPSGTSFSDTYGSGSLNSDCSY